MCRTPRRRASAAADPVSIIAAGHRRAAVLPPAEMRRRAPSPCQCLEQGLLGGEPSGQRLGPVDSCGALRQLRGSVDPRLEVPAVPGERLRDSFRLHDVEAYPRIIGRS